MTHPTMAISLVDLILKARASEDGTFTHVFAGDRRLTVNTRDRSRTHYILASGFYEVDYLTRRAAANVCRVMDDVPGMVRRPLGFYIA